MQGKGAYLSTRGWIIAIPLEYAGLRRRLGEEVRKLAGRSGRYHELGPVVSEDHLCIVNDALCPRNLAVWVGSSIMATLQDTVEVDRYVSRTKYLTSSLAPSCRIPDWLAVLEGPGAE